MVASSPTTSLASHLAHYQATQPDWHYAPLAAELHRWAAIMDTEWDLDLPTLPVLHFAPIRNAYATYAWARGPIGTPDNITLNTATLERPPVATIRTLGHELLHLWQRYHGKPSPQRNYHNDEYCRKAKECGILIDAQGCTSGHTEVFTALVAKHGIDLPGAGEEGAGNGAVPLGVIEVPLYGNGGGSGRGSKMKKWTCGCTVVRCATPLSAVCARCMNEFNLEG